MAGGVREGASPGPQAAIAWIHPRSARASVAATQRCRRLLVGRCEFACGRSDAIAKGATSHAKASMHHAVGGFADARLHFENVMRLKWRRSSGDAVMQLKQRS